MKKKFLRKLCVTLALLPALIFSGCMSAQKLIEKGDDVSAIEKLAKKLTKKPASQEDADLFVSVYPNAVENRLGNTQTVSDVINNFVTSNGASSVGAALANIKSSLPEGSFIGDESSVRSAISKATLAYTRAEDLYRIQKAVRPMPLEIGDYAKGEVYWVEKYNDDFAGDYKLAGSEMAEFVYAVADAGYPGKTRNEKQRDYELFDTVRKYDSSLTSDCNQKQARLAYDIGDIYKETTVISEKKTAIDWYKKADGKVSGYNGVKDKILLTNYEIGELYLEKFESGNSRYDLKDAIYYFGYAKDYKDAPIRKAYCESLLDELDHPVEVVEGEELKMEVTMGELAFSDTMTAATIPIKVSGVDYILTANDFSITKTSAIEKVDVASTRSSATPATTVTYIATITPVDPDRFSYGTVGIEVRDKGKNVVESKSYGVDTKKFFVPADISVAKTEYSKTDSDVTLSFGTNHLKKKLAVKDLIVNGNETGATLSELKLASEYDSTKALYEVTFTGIEKGGNISIAVIGDDGSPLPCYDHVTSLDTKSAKYDISYKIDYSKVYVPPVVQSIAKGIVANERYFFEGDDIWSEKAICFESPTVVWFSGMDASSKVSCKIDSKTKSIYFEEVIGSSLGGVYWTDELIGKELYFDVPTPGRIVIYEDVYHGDLDDPTMASKRYLSSWTLPGEADVRVDYDDVTELPPVPYAFVGKMYYGDEQAIEFLSEEKLRYNNGEQWLSGLTYKVNPDERQIKIMDGKKQIMLLEYYIEYQNNYYLFDTWNGIYWTTRNPWID